MFTKIIKSDKFNNIFGSEFEFINTGFADGRFNMDFDSQKLEDVINKKSLPMFRVYGWKPWAVSLGANQKESDINAEECRRRNIDIVRRPTGGRAVLHANEITYSVVTPIPKNSSAANLYRDIHLLIIETLRKSGKIVLDFEKSQPNFHNFYKSEVSSLSCFASAARYEIEFNGKKLVGSAQKISDGVLLQHGSILLGRAYEIISELANVSSQELKERLKEFTLAHSTTLEEILNREITFEEVAENFFIILNSEH
jgi:lipoate-protein ligase A